MSDRREPFTHDVWGKPMSKDEQEAKSVRYTYGALIVPLESGNYGVFTKFHEFIRTCTADELIPNIKEAAEKGRNTKLQVEYETRYAKNFKRPSVPSSARPVVRAPVVEQIVESPEEMGY